MKIRTFLVSLAAMFITITISAKEKNLRLETPNMAFEVSSDGSKAAFIVTDRPEEAVWDNDLWRLILDDGLNLEIPVRQTQQKGKVTLKRGIITMEYDGVVSEWGQCYPILFRLEVSVEDGLFKFTPCVENNADGVRVNECFAPFANFTSISGEKDRDALFLPNALGRRIENPWKYMESQNSSYYNHGEYETVISMPYPRSSMPWLGVQSGNKFLYVARYDKDARWCYLTVHQRIHYDPQDIMLGINHLPMARTGEKIQIASTSVGLLDGDWRAGADRYRAWADANFFKVVPKADWVKNVTGWQRILFRESYGKQLYTAKDLPHIYEVGKQYGVNSIFIFAWWKDGMDRGYPDYTEPYPGAYAELRENIKKVQDMGGHVILACNCTFVDPATEYYKLYGEEVALLDINGYESRGHYGYAGRGDFRVSWGKNQLPRTCTGTQRWRDQVVDQLKFMGDELGADCVFADCYGGCPIEPCFNARHEHGFRVDEEAIAKRKFFDDAVAYTEDAGNVLGTEVLTDLAASYVQFVHGGTTGHTFAIRSDEFPQLFRYTFPEVITTNRGVRSSEGEFDRQMKYAMLTGMRMDAELWCCRSTIDADEKYASVVKFCTDKLNEYKEFFFDGKFTVINTEERPWYLKLGEFYNAEGSKILRILFNASNREDVRFKGTVLGPDDMKFEIFDAASYLAANK